MHLHEFRASSRTQRHKSRIVGKVVVECPSSIALEEIKRHFEATHGVLKVSVALHDIARAANLEPMHAVRVEFECRPNRLFIGRNREHMLLKWMPEPTGPFPDFEGELTILPLGTKTELSIWGEYTPPLGRFGAGFDQWIGNRLARTTIDRLLQELKSVLEAEFQALKRKMED